LFARKDQALLVMRDAFLVHDVCLHIANCIGWLYLKSDRLAGRLAENL